MDVLFPIVIWTVAIGKILLGVGAWIGLLVCEIINKEEVPK